MNRITALLFTLILVLVALPSWADSLEHNGLDQAALGFNGVLTSVADPVLGLTFGDDLLGEPPFVAPVTNRLVGVVTGSFRMVFRATTGVMDLMMAVFPESHVSPDPRFALVPGTPKVSNPPPGF